VIEGSHWNSDPSAL